MRLYVNHRTEYLFSQPQARVIQLLRMSPGNHGGQSIVGWAIGVDHDARLKPVRDGYGNGTTMLYIDGPVERLSITVTGEVLTEDRAGVIDGAIETLPPLYYLQPTALTQADGAIADFAAGLTAGDALSQAHRLCDTLHDLLTTAAADPLLDHRASVAFASKRTDAQGAAHLLIAAARAIGMPARYVAGHLHRREALDAHAAHGWAELYVENYGWIGFDALEGCCPTDDYVRVAIGLDHREAAPISGARIGRGQEVLAVDVRVGPQPRQD